MRKLKAVADLHLHSRYSRATSESMGIKEIARYAKIKGLNLVGTGDFTHPKWLQELKEVLVKDADSGFYHVEKGPVSHVRFVVTTEVCTMWTVHDQTKKVHHVIVTPSLETAIQTNDRLAKYGSLTSDGRPTLSMSAAHLVEEVMETSNWNMVFPAHAWTPWFSIFGAFSGFNSVEECYEDKTRHIHALETGLSSDPPMNWRLGILDKFTLLSNSDSHSYWPWRMGREANVFELERFDYREVIEIVRLKDAHRFKYTIETDPAYGKYHWTGHRACNVSLSPKEASKFADICPVCRRTLTKGVEQRVQELSDRPVGFKPENAVGFMRLLPLHEIITTVLGVDSPAAQKIWGIYTPLIERFGDEYTVLIDASKEALASVAGEAVADAIVRVREGRARVVPGYDGVYGKLVLSEEVVRAEKTRPGKVQQLNLADFI